MKESKYTLSVIVPFFNESKRINIFFEEMDHFSECFAMDYEVILVDDASDDDTLNKLEVWAEQRPYVRVIGQPNNAGKGRALARGIESASGKYILTCDADMSAKPSELLNWIEKYDIFNSERTIFIGNRKDNETKLSAKGYRKLIGLVFSKLVNLLIGLNIQDTQCGFKLYPIEFGKEVFATLTDYGWAHDVEILLLAKREKLKVVECQLTWVHNAGSKVNIISDSIKMFLQIIRLSFNYRNK